MDCNITNYKLNRRKELICAGVFASVLVLVLIVAISVAIVSTGPIVLGSEMNTNGMVEYLCLGRGCDAYTSMDW